MDFIFLCPDSGRTFESEHFEIIDNRGIGLDAAGNKFLDARVRLTLPCPACGAHHIFNAKDLACPFTTSDVDGGEAFNGRR